jgi:hypothetical protein
MKTIQYTKWLLVLAFSAISVISCKKDIQPSKTGPSNPSPVQDMVILDHGSSNDTTKNMQVVFTSQSYTISNSNSNSSGWGAKINVSFYSNKDNMIPSGNYFYSNSDGKVPFTFSDATVHISDNYLKEEDFAVNSGTITVSTDGINYSVQFSGVLSSGDSFSATYKGGIFYSDTFQ